MIWGHVAGLPVEETVLGFAPAGVVLVAALRGWLQARHARHRGRPSHDAHHEARADGTYVAALADPHDRG